MTYARFKDWRTTELIEALAMGDPWPMDRYGVAPEDAVWGELDRRLRSGRSPHAGDQVPSHVDTPAPGLTWQELAAVNSGRKSLALIEAERQLEEELAAFEELTDSALL